MMLESYLRTPDGKEYVDVSCVEEALGIVDEDMNIFGVIKKLREDNDRLREKVRKTEQNLVISRRLSKEDRDFIDDVCEAIGIQRPHIENDYDKAVRLIAEIKSERDRLKEKCDKLKTRTNALYDTSCGYSGNKAPAFLCDVISYSWEFGTTLDTDSIRVELDLTPNANYKGSFDLEDLKKYIQEYGREKKLGIIESVDYQNAKVARAELANLYKTVLGKDRLDRDLSPHEVMKAIHDEYKRVKDSRFAFSQSLQSVYMHVYEGTGYNTSDIYAAPEKIANWIITRYDSTKQLGHMETLCDINDFIDELCNKYNVVQPKRSYTTRERLDYIFSVLSENRERYNSEWKWVEQLKKEKQAIIDSLAELRAKVREIYRSVVDDEWDMSLSYTSALNDINEEYKRVVHNFEERTADWSKAQQELDRYRLAVGSLLDIPKETRDDINAIERSFTFSKKKYESLKEFRDNVCEIFDIPSSMADKYVLKEIHDITDRYDELEDFRADICGALDIEGMLGTPQQNDKYILEQVEKLKKTPNQDAFRYAICNALDMPTTVIDGNIIGRIHLMQDRCDKLARLRSNICTALCLGGKTSDEDILKKVRMTKDCHDKLCKDYTELVIAIWEAMDRKPETLPKETARLVGEVRMLQMNYQNMRRFERDYGAAQKILSDISEFRKCAIEDLKRRGIPVSGLECPECIDVSSSDIFRKLLNLYDDYFSRYKEQFGLRQMWHVRWESENERANGVQKALDREREKCRVKDISLETAKKQYEKVCGNLETAECALNGMKSKVRELREEKTKVISALGQDIWDDAVK